MMLRAIELMIAWYNGCITDGEFLSELQLALRRASKSWNLNGR